MQVAESLLRAERHWPAQPFVTAGETTLTFAEFTDRVRRFARRLVEEGVGPGRRIMLLFPNGLDYLTAYMAGHWVGATVVPMDASAHAGAVQHVWLDTGASLLVHAQQLAPNCPEIKTLAYAPAVERLPALSGAPVLRDGHPALIMYTSGTTGLPKGVALADTNLVFTAQAIVNWAGMRQSDRELTTLRLSHSFGLGHFHCYMLTGGRFYVEPSLADIPATLARLAEYEITGFPTTPAAVRLILDNHLDALRQYGRKVRYVIVNTSPMAPELTRRLLEALPDTDVYMYYGLTEASRSTYIHYNHNTERLASVGRPPAGVEVRIERVSGMNPGHGEILVRGRNVMVGYWGQDSGCDPSGWFRTGDIGYTDAEDFLYVTGRIKEQINIDGLKCSPIEVEEALRQNPKVRDVAVIGMPDPLTYERVVACVVTQPEHATPKFGQELRRFCKGRIDLYKIPREVHFVDAIPRTGTGKVRRVELRQRLEEGGKI